MTDTPNLPCHTGRTVLAEGRFLHLDRIEYRDRHGHDRKWEAAMRTGNQGAVLMIPVLRPSGRLVILRQYRPPLDAYVLEFPAGLIDPGEPPATTAVRELLEETGYVGELRWIGRPASSSAGMTGETVTMAFIDIDEALPENRNPVPRLEASEDIEVLVVAPAELPDFLRAREAEGMIIDSRAVAYFMGIGVTW
jgi:8-oxo-dGTP pyrophosphatase MutT (NUDIX family)